MLRPGSLLIACSSLLVGCASFTIPNPHIAKATDQAEELSPYLRSGLNSCRAGFANDYPAIKILPTVSERLCVRNFEATYALAVYQEHQQSLHQEQVLFGHSLVLLAAAGAAAVLSDMHASVVESIAGTSVLVGGYEVYSNPRQKYPVLGIAADKANCLVSASAEAESLARDWEEAMARLNGNGASPGVNLLFALRRRMATTVAAEGIELGQAAYDQLDDAVRSGLFKTQKVVANGIRASTGETQDLIGRIKAEAQRQQEAEDKAAQGNTDLMSTSEEAFEAAANDFVSVAAATGSDLTGSDLKHYTARLLKLSPELNRVLSDINACTIEVSG